MQHPSGQGTCIESVDNDLRDAPCLSEEDIKINIKIAIALEEHYALSQDIEFGIDHGKISILQMNRLPHGHDLFISDSTAPSAHAAPPSLSPLSPICGLLGEAD